MSFSRWKRSVSISKSPRPPWQQGGETPCPSRRTKQNEGNPAMEPIADALPRFQFLTPEHREYIHRASLEILRRTGVRVHHAETVKMLAESDAMVTEENRVFFPASLVEWAVRQVPDRIMLCKRGQEEPTVWLEEGPVHFGAGSDCNNYLDPETGAARPFTTKEIAACVRLVDALPEIDFCMSMGSPNDVAEAERFRIQFALMMENTAKPIVFIADGRADCEAIHAMAVAAAGSEDYLRLHPNLLGYGMMTTPLVQPGESLEKLLFMAEKQIPAVHQPAPMMGGTAPFSLAGGLALGNAEVLSSLVIHQLRRPGAPFVYGCGLHHMDMRTTLSVYNAPEWLLARAGTAEMARYYRLPRFGYAGHTDSNAMDEQAASDAFSSVMMAFLTREHLAHDVGYMESGLTTSPELIVFSDEAISGFRAFDKGVSFDPESLALDVIHQVGPGGNHMNTPHTFQRFRDFWSPSLFNRKRRTQWEKAGSPTLGKRLRDKTISLMESHRPEPLGDSVREEIDYILKNSGFPKAPNK
ncbi:MAG: trimethylamine methyltransferase family protein [Desulfococcaceae bacterium]